MPSAPSPRISAASSSRTSSIEGSGSWYGGRYRPKTTGGPSRDILSTGGGGPTATGIAPPASEGVAEAIVGAGEALANWWLNKPDVPRQDVADCAGVYLDAGAAAFLTDLMEKHSRAAWGLRAFLETPAG